MNILFATDGSENSEGAARYLTRFNFSRNDKITILHAISLGPVISEWEITYVDLKEARAEIIPQIIESSENILKATGAVIETSVVEDYPDKAITGKSVETGSDLIVMGASGVKGLASHIIGSVTRLVAIKSERPVLVIKPPQWKSSGKTKVLFATDGSVYSASVGRFLTSIPFPDDTEVTMLNVLSPVLSDIPERFAIEINDRLKGLVAKEREKEFKESATLLEKARSDLHGKFAAIEKLTKLGDPSLEIINVAEAMDADIIAIGSSGMRGIKGMLGSISRYVVNHCNCSVLIGKG